VSDCVGSDEGGDISAVRSQSHPKIRFGQGGGTVLDLDLWRRIDLLAVSPGVYIASLWRRDAESRSRHIVCLSRFGDCITRHNESCRDRIARAHYVARRLIRDPRPFGDEVRDFNIVRSQ
jgi:hypothetical protein